MVTTSTRKPPPKSASGNAKKRKSSGVGDVDDDNKPLGHQPKQPKISAFFTPRVSLNTTCGTDKTTSVAKLSEEQSFVFDLVMNEGKNVFFTGSAGTGKSLLLRAIISALKRKYSSRPDYIAVTASTGMAASNIGGMTVHSWGAITPGSNDIDSQIRCIRTCKPALQRWKNVKIMIIDEASMLDGDLFNTLATLAERLRKKTNRPFGGIQLVVTGDFFQLPPVCKGEEVFFAFESETWKSCIEHTVTLSKVFRQRDDRFVSLLNELRHGTISAEASKIFKSLSRPLPPPPPSMPNILPTELFPMRHQVSNANSTRLKALPHTLRVFHSYDTFSNALEASTTTNKPSSAISAKHATRSNHAPYKPMSAPSGNNKREGLLSGVPAEKILELKEGAQVMLVKNVDEMLVNGCVGQVVGFFKYREMMSAIHGENDNKRAVVAKTTGFVRNVKVAPDDSLLRVVASGGSAGKENAENGERNPKDKTAAQKEGEAFPLVEFPTPVGGKEAVLVMREEFRVEDSEGKLLARRMQVPLILAWAMSIHKSQGQTIQRVKVDLEKVFEKGQSYVALSRAASMDGLQVLGFDSKKVMAHPKVVEWSKSLQMLGETPSGSRVV